MSTAADIASILGVLIGIIGFALVIVNVRRSKSAAEQAQQAVIDVRKDIQRVDTVANFSAAMTAMAEIKRLHRQSAWTILPDRYSALRASLISIKVSNPALPDHQSSALQGAIQNLRGIEEIVEKALASNETPENIPRLNRTVTRDLDSLQEILVEIQSQIGG